MKRRSLAVVIGILVVGGVYSIYRYGLITNSGYYKLSIQANDYSGTLYLSGTYRPLDTGYAITNTMTYQDKELGRTNNQTLTYNTRDDTLHNIEISNITSSGRLSYLEEMFIDMINQNIEQINNSPITIDFVRTSTQSIPNKSYRRTHTRKDNNNQNAEFLTQINIYCMPWSVWFHYLTCHLSGELQISSLSLDHATTATIKGNLKKLIGNDTLPHQ